MHKFTSKTIMPSEKEDLGFSAPIDQPHKSLRPFIPEIISRGGGVRGEILPLFEEKPGLGVDGDDVDTSLALSTAVSTNSTTDYSIVVAVAAGDSNSPIYNPMPLQCYDPNPVMVNQAAGKRKRGNGDGSGSSRKREKRSNSGGDAEDDRRLPNSIRIEEFPELVRALNSRNVEINGGGVVFLYRKRLEDSDVKVDQNRLFVTRREAVMEFLTAEEAAAVEESTKGVAILGVDEGGEPYNLVLKKWKSLNVTVINADWNKLVAANGAKKGDTVQIWGFRHEDGKPGFAIVFRR